MSASCKFCGATEGSIGRRGNAIHINRDTLCGPCYTLLEKVKRQPDKVAADEMVWFETACKQNITLGMFVPIVQRRQAPWSCKRCGKQTNRDEHYTNNCVSCAEEIRHNRLMPPKSQRKVRSDKKCPGQ